MAGNSFHFEFDSVLHVRDRNVEIAQEALGRAVRARVAQEESVASAKAAMQSMLDSDGTVAGIAARVLVDAAAHRRTAADALASARSELQLLTDAETLTRRSLADALRHREALRTLKDAAEEEHRTTNYRAETNMLDDLAMARASARALAA